MTETETNSIAITGLGSLLTFLASWFWFQKSAAVAQAKKLEEQREALAARVAQMEGQLALVNQTIIPISTAFQSILVRELTHYHEAETDELLAKIGPPNTLTEIEQNRLSELLKKRTTDMGPLISASERDAATMLPLVMKRAVEEQKVLGVAEALRLKLVTVAAVVGVPADTIDSEAK